MNHHESEALLGKLGFGDLHHKRTERSSVTTAWGVNWNEELVARDLMQNFFDADRKRVDDIKVTSEAGKVRVTSPTPYNLERLFYLGSEKGPMDVGKYGEGFKAAAVCMLRDHGTSVVAASGSDVLRIRIDDEPVANTELYPLVYEFFTTSPAVAGNVLVIQRASAKLAHALQHGLEHFYHGRNPLLGRHLDWDGGNFLVYESKGKSGHMFYRDLKRGVIPDLPLVLVLNKEYAAIEKRIANDRDRNAFEDAVRDTFYDVWAKSYFSGYPSREKVVVEAARSLWERGVGHPLLSRIASRSQSYKDWGETMAADVFQSKYFARSQARSPQDDLRFRSVEHQWEQDGRKPLPAYFSHFGVPSAERHCRKVDAQARLEACAKHRRAATAAEGRSIQCLAECVRMLAPSTMSHFDSRRTSYSVAETEVVLGELRISRPYKSPEVFLSASVFENDFARALAVFLHEHSHIFGGDGSRGFTDALTELLEAVVRHRDLLSAREAAWERCRVGVLTERNESGKLAPSPSVSLEELSPEEMRMLLKRLPTGALRHLMEDEASEARTTPPPNNGSGGLELG